MADIWEGCSHFDPTALAWLATSQQLCFNYLISQVALWLTIRAERPPAYAVLIALALDLGKPRLGL
jgi:hypothetical protein